MRNRSTKIRNYARKIPGGESFTNHPSGNLVDGLQPAANSDLDIIFGIANEYFPKIVNLFFPYIYIFFPGPLCHGTSCGSKLIQFGGLIVENGWSNQST